MEINNISNNNLDKKILDTNGINSLTFSHIELGHDKAMGEDRNELNNDLIVIMDLYKKYNEMLKESGSIKYDRYEGDEYLGKSIPNDFKKIKENYQGYEIIDSDLTIGLQALVKEVKNTGISGYLEFNGIPVLYENKAKESNLQEYQNDIKDSVLKQIA